MAAKLAAYGMDPSAVQLLISYLRNRFQRVKVGPARSEWRSLMKGVPQGSILGPSLFNLFLNDYLYFVRSSVVNYADDNTICVTGETLDDCLNSCVTDIDISLDWFGRNQMQLNAGKSIQVPVHAYLQRF